MSTMEIPSGEGALRGRGPRDSGRPGRPGGSGGADGHGACGSPGGAAGPGTSGGTPWSARWQPLAGAALLERLRVTGRPRPAADPALSGDLRSFLESGLDEVLGQAAGSRQAAGSGLVVTQGRLTGALACPAHRVDDQSAEHEFTIPLATGALIDVLFRQLVTTGSIDDPMADALDGLSIDAHRASLVDWMHGLAQAERRELRSEVERQADGLLRRWPALDPSWLPRTQTPLRAVIAGGQVDLSVYVDLVIGRPAADVASVAFVDVRSGARRPGHRDDRHLGALVEALRAPAPPFAVATYYTKTGELDVDPVDSDLLAAAARRCLAGIRAMDSLSRGEEPEGTGSESCTMCALGLASEPDLATVPIGAISNAAGAISNAAEAILHVTEARVAAPSTQTTYAQGQAA